MAEDSAKGLRQGWAEFIHDYGAVGRTLLIHYFPGLTSDIDMHLAGAFARANADNNAWFRTLRFSNEREFAMQFRAFLFAYGNEIDRVPVPKLDTSALGQAQEGLSLVQRQLLWIYLRGWSAEEASAILLSAPSTALEMKPLADQRLSQLSRTGRPYDMAAMARVAMTLAEAGGTADCISWKTMDNIINGQIAWRDREFAERHMIGCIHCLNAFTSFQEMIWLRKAARPLPESQVENVLKELRLKAPTSKGLLSRLLAG